MRKLLLLKLPLSIAFVSVALVAAVGCSSDDSEGGGATLTLPDASTLPDSGGSLGDGGGSSTPDGASNPPPSNDGGGSKVDAGHDGSAPSVDGSAPANDASARDPGSLAKKMVMYWGTGGGRELADVCQNLDYDVLVLSFVDGFGAGSRDLNGLPELDLGGHGCVASDASNPYLPVCAQVGADIQTCQNLGKTVLISMGGGAGSYSFSSDTQGQTFAQTMWDLFLGGSSPSRPFGNAVVDGVDLDIEGGPTTGYSAFVKTLRAKMDASSRKYFITGAPQCPYPDAYLGPSAGTPLGDAPTAFDALFVQFYNNYCSYPGGSSFNFTQWAGLHSGGGPLVFVGLPASTSAAGSGFVDPSQFSTLVSSVKSNAAFGGLMMWDAYWDEQTSYNSTTNGSYAATLVH